jgi:hypothetical protein
LGNASGIEGARMSPLTVDDFVAACAFVLLCIAGALA